MGSHRDGVSSNYKSSKRRVSEPLKADLSLTVLCRSAIVMSTLSYLSCVAQ